MEQQESCQHCGKELALCQTEKADMYDRREADGVQEAERKERAHREVWELDHYCD